MKYTQRTSIKTLLSTLSFVAVFSASNSYAEVSQTPLSLTIGVPPNLILTLDESGSMSWGFVPDSVESSVINGSTITRLYAANHFNPMYYNPNTTYLAPPFFDTNGAETTLTTSYTSAYINGFRPTAGSTLNLSSNYRPTGKEYRMPSGTHNRVTNPPDDFTATITFDSNTTKEATTSAGIKFSVTRTGSSNNNRVYTCTILVSGPVTNNTNFSCTRNNNTYTAQTPAYYYTYDKTLSSCNDTKSDINCYKINFVQPDEEQNFANWYSFYRTRALATLSATSLAFAQLSPSIRLTWQNLSLCKTFTGTDTTNCKDNRLRQYDNQHKGQFYSWLKDIYFNSGTPLPAAMTRAGEFLKTDVAWHQYPNSRDASKTNNTQNTYACRASYHILMTDGMWNDSTTTEPDPFRHDNTTFTLPDNKVLSPIRPYSDATEKTLADLAMHYWATDLNTNLNNKIPAYIPFKSGDTNTDYWDPRNDPATWQHMTNFIMGLGLTSSLNNSNIPWSGSTYTGGLENITSGTANWPAAGSGSANNVYDLWHAAINSRGEFFSADSPETMVQAFEDILKRIADRKSTAARPAINSGQISTDINDNGVVKTVSYQTSYASDENWAGDLKRFEKAWNAQSNTFETTLIWNASDKIPGWGSRNIKIAGDTNNGLVDFTWENAGNSNTQGTLAYWLSRNPEEANTSDSRGPDRLNYLRGNRAGEGSTFRTRSSILGDFYSSTPAVVLGPRYLTNIANTLEGEDAADYAEFAGTAKERTPRTYVGSNDGMLHGFNALTGAEEFAFIPSAVFNKLNKLTGNNYSHEFYVDGSPVVADIYDGTAWRTILVGTLKAGGKAIFALDITTPGQEELLWEFDDSALTESDVKMGYSFSQPTIARLHNGKWAVVFGNGYESEGNTNGKAALFIVDAVDGTLMKSLEVEGTDGSANGLSTPKLGDYNADGVADYAYAGDLQGNVWRFDLLRSNRSSADPYTRSDDAESATSDFKVSYGGAPLFKATFNNVNQPITSAPSLVLHPSGTGYLVMVGTGKFFETGDKEGNKNIAQSVYGIWDKETRGETASNPRIARSSLQQQEILTTTTVSAVDGTSRQGRVISNNAINWDTQNGWFLNLPQTDGEMVVENMSQLGRTLFLQSLVPNSDPCGDGANNWTYAINPFTGGRTYRNSFDYTPTTDVGTNNISAIRQDGEGGGTISQNSDNTFQYCTGQECTNIYPDPSSLGRQSWRRVETED